MFMTARCWLTLVNQDVKMSAPENEGFRKSPVACVFERLRLAPSCQIHSSNGARAVCYLVRAIFHKVLRALSSMEITTARVQFAQKMG